MTIEKGIYLLANDNVYDQVVALINSIEANYSKDIPICIIPFNDSLDLIRQEVARRPQLSLFEDRRSIEKWENFIKKFQEIYLNYPIPGVDRKKVEILTMHRKYCAFDGDFEKFIYIDTDCLVFQSLEHIFKKLEEYEFVVHDFQRNTDIRTGTVDYFFEAFKDQYSSKDELAKRFHCGGFWASRRQMFTEEDLSDFLTEAEAGDARIFKTPWKTEEVRQLSEQTTINYMTLKKQLKLYNFTLEEDSSPYKTGCNVTSKHFEEKDRILYDKGKRLTYLHYMGIKSHRIKHLCEIEKLNLPLKKLTYKLADKFLKWGVSSIPYRDIFLYYRFLNS
ncbi:Npun_R2821/Npun_R2822 family protein [Baaleninema sp.]|uniref:Npun_R2821/Npun_R2822 family protein n=1 Tax=Baaleninema sp. TaxID=3101197 RepID=UPI003D053BD6